MSVTPNDVTAFNGCNVNKEIPIYIRHVDVLFMNGDIALQLCQTADRLIPSCATGAQKIKGFWQLCVNSYTNRKTILNSKFSIQNTVIKLHDRNPYDSEKKY